MNRIAEEVESEEGYRDIMQAQHAEPEATGADAIAAAARQIADTLDLSAIICWTFSGSTALRVARERPQVPIVAISPNVADRPQALGGLGHPLRGGRGRARPGRHGGARLPPRLPDGFAKAGRRVIIVAGLPLGTPGATNMLRIAFVGADTASGD